MITKRRPTKDTTWVALGMAVVLLLTCVAHTLTHNDEVADQAAKTCENVRYSNDNPKECDE